LVVIALIGTLGAVVWLILLREPVYNGRKLSQWLEMYVAPQQSVELDSQADQAVRHIGAKAIPTLLRMAGAQDSRLTLNCLALLRKQDVVEIRYHGAIRRNVMAEEGFRALGADASQAVPGLIAICLRASPAKSWGPAITSLGNIGPPAADAVPLLVSAATNADPGISSVAIVALGRIHGQPGLAVPVLGRLLHHTNRTTFYFGGDPGLDNTIEALENFGPAARLAVPDLLYAMNATDDPNQRFHLANALKAIDPEAAAKAGVR